MRRFRKWIVLTGVIVIGIVVTVALLGPDPRTAESRAFERRVREWKPASLHVLSDKTLLASDVDLSGDWGLSSVYTSAGITFVPRSGNEFDVHFSTSSCTGQCEWSRTATFVNGTITLDRAVAVYAGEAFHTLYAIRIEGGECLLADPYVPAFEEQLRRDSGNLDWCVFKRPGDQAPADNAVEP